MGTERQLVTRQTFTCFIEDRRYSVPTLRFLEADGDPGSLRELVRRELLASENHQAIEVCTEGGQVVLREVQETRP